MTLQERHGEPPQPVQVGAQGPLAPDYSGRTVMRPGCTRSRCVATDTHKDYRADSRMKVPTSLSIIGFDDFDFAP